MLNDKEFIEKGYLISTDKSLLDFDVIFKFLGNESYWAKNVPETVVRNSIENSLTFGVYHDRHQVGFARIITDKATFAYLADVFVLPDHRGLGLSKWLMQNIRSHAELQGFRRWILATRDAHSLYAKFGFVPLSKPENFMEIFNPYVVK